MLHKQLKQYLRNNGVEFSSVVGDSVMITDNKDGKGPFISVWELDIPQPSAEQLAQLVVDPRVDYAEKRKAEYGSVQEQLDEIFHNTDAWKVRIASIKAKYPKPE